MEKIIAGLSLALLLVGCSSLQTKSEPTQAAMRKPAIAVQASSTPVATVMPDLTPAKQSCATLKAQLQTQLPFQIQEQMQWNNILSHDPLQPNGPLMPACQLLLHADGATIQKLGLTANFMSATLDRLGWQTNAQTNAYAADGPTGHREAMINASQLAVLSYTFAPPANVCSQNQPIANCDYPRKKWLYQMELLILG